MGIGILATIAESHGHAVRIFDMAVETSTLESVVEEFRPDVTGLSFLSTSSSLVGGVVDTLKKSRGGRLIAGGIHASIFPQDTLELGVDVVVIGEGEDVLEALLDKLGTIQPDKGIPRGWLDGVPGIAYKDDNGQVTKISDQSEPVKLEGLPFINRDLFSMQYYPHHSIITSRGCPHGCKFCCAWGPGPAKSRCCSPGKVVSEFAYLAEKYGPSTIYLADDMFFFNEESRLEFCRLLREARLPVKWVTQLRAKDLNPRVVSEMLQAGCEKICIGAESGSDKILRVTAKDCNREQLVAGINAAVMGGMKVKTWWIIGLPGGDLEDQVAALEVIEQTRPHEIAVHTFVPLPGSFYWDNAEKYGIRLPGKGEMGKLFYYESPGSIALDYMPSEMMSEAISLFESRLDGLGYVPTDRADSSSRYVYTTPRQSTTFKI